MLTEETPEHYLVQYIPNGSSEAQGAESIDSGGTVENRLIVYELPHTGGIGTTWFTASGGLLVLVAALLLLLRAGRRRERRLSG